MRDQSKVLHSAVQIALAGSRLRWLLGFLESLLQNLPVQAVQS